MEDKPRLQPVPNQKKVSEAADPALLQNLLLKPTVAPSPAETASYEQRFARLQQALERLHKQKGEAAITL